MTVRITNIRGTGGSGKSTLVRRVMDLYPERLPGLREGRRRPVSYGLTGGDRRPLVVLGHYETPCGGCDTLKTVDEVYDLVRQAVGHGTDVLYEGIMVADDVRRAVELSRDPRVDLQVILLTTPVDLCLAAINERRAARDDQAAPVDPKNTRARAERHLRAVLRLKDAGVRTLRLDREAAYTHMLERTRA